MSKPTEDQINETWSLCEDLGAMLDIVCDDQKLKEKVAKALEELQDSFPEPEDGF